MACFKLPRRWLGNFAEEAKEVKEILIGSLGGLWHTQNIWEVWGLGIWNSPIFLSLQDKLGGFCRIQFFQYTYSKINLLPGTTILDANLGSHTSQIWRAIIEACDVLLQTLIRETGDGASTEIWNHSWLPREGMMWPITTPSNVNIHLVWDLIDETLASWKEDLVRATFLPMDPSIISSISLCTWSMPDFGPSRRRRKEYLLSNMHIVC